jgi:hypothetical protein
MRIAMTFTGLATAGLCTLALAHPAEAAQGTLILGDSTYTDPHGCYNLTVPGPVTNHTNMPATIYPAPWCAGAVAGVVEPGQSGFVRAGRSVFIP